MNSYHTTPLQRDPRPIVGARTGWETLPLVPMVGEGFPLATPRTCTVFYELLIYLFYFYLDFIQPSSPMPQKL